MHIPLLGRRNDGQSRDLVGPNIKRGRKVGVTNGVYPGDVEGRRVQLCAHTLEHLELLLPLRFVCLFVIVCVYMYVLYL